MGTWRRKRPDGGSSVVALAVNNSAEMSEMSVRSKDCSRNSFFLGP